MRICFLLLASTALSMRGDTVELKTGERIEGTFKQATSVATVIEVGGQAITIPSEKVQTIYFGAIPQRTVAGQTSLQEAMDALKALRSVTGSGIAYRDYSQRVLDTRVKVDRYLSSPGSDSSTELRGAIRVAILEYELASQGWLAGSSPMGHANLWEPMGKILETPEVSQCPVAKALIDLRNSPPPAPTRKSKYLPNPTSKPDPTVELGILFAMKQDAPASIWPCASHKVAEAERLLGQR